MKTYCCITYYIRAHVVTKGHARAQNPALIYNGRRSLASNYRGSYSTDNVRVLYASWRCAKPGPRKTAETLCENRNVTRIVSKVVVSRNSACLSSRHAIFFKQWIINFFMRRSLSAIRWLLCKRPVCAPVFLTMIFLMTLSCKSRWFYWCYTIIKLNEFISKSRLYLR